MQRHHVFPLLDWWKLWLNIPSNVFPVFKAVIKYTQHKICSQLFSFVPFSGLKSILMVCNPHHHSSPEFFHLPQWEFCTHWTLTPTPVPSQCRVILKWRSELEHISRGHCCAGGQRGCHHPREYPGVSNGRRYKKQLKKDKPNSSS